jgi:hypothetical protein
MRTPWARSVGLSVIATLGVVATLGASPVNASASTTFNVPCGNIKLLETAVGTPGSTINLTKGCTYQLTDIVVRDPCCNSPLDQLPIVTGSVTINGHGATLLGIPSTSPSGFGQGCGRILEVGKADGTAPGYLTLNSVTLTKGYLVSQGNGGGGLLINSGSTAILNESVVKKNTSACNCGSSGGGFGGGIFNAGGTLKLNNSRVIANVVPDYGGAGVGIASFGGTLSINRSQVNGNIGVHGDQAGGILAIGTPTIVVTLVDSSVSGNKVADGPGSGGNGAFAACGGIGFGGGTFKLVNTTVAGNSVSGLSSGGGAFNYAGGGICIGSSSSVVIDQSQIRNNTVSSPDPAAPAYGGGLVNYGGTVTFIGGAVEFNAATNSGGGSADGGGIFNSSGSVTRTGTTVTSNTPDNWS